MKPDLILQAGHTKAINAVAFSPDGRWLASGSKDNTIKIWDTATGNVLRTIYGHSSSVNTVAISPDGKLLASGSGDFADRRDIKVILKGGVIGGLEDNTARIWDVQTGRELKVFRGHELPVGAVAFSNDGRSLISASVDSIRVWDVGTGSESRSFKTSFEKSKKGDSVIGFLDMHPKKDKQTMERTRSIGALTSKMNISSNGQLVAIGLPDKDVKLYDALAGRESRGLTFRMTPESENSSVAFSPDARLVAYGRTSDIVSVQEAAAGREVFKLQTGFSKSPQRLAFSPDGRFLVTSIDAGAGAAPDVLKLWDVTTGQFVRELKPGGDARCGSRTLAISRDNRLFASVVSGSKVISIGELTTGKELRSLQTGTIDETARAERAAFIKSIDSKVISKLEERGITTPEQIIEALEALGRVSNDTYPVGDAVSFTPDGRLLISRHMLLKSMATECWNTSNGTLAQVPNDGALQDRGKPFFSPDGRYRAIPYTAMSGFYPSASDFFKPSAGGLSLFGVAKGPDFGKVYDQEVRLYEGKSEKKPRELSGGKAPDVGVVPAIGFSFDSKLVAMTGFEKNERLILIYEAATGRKVNQFKIIENDQSGAVGTLTISADGRQLAAGYANKIDIFETNTGRTLRTLPHAGRITSLTFSPDGRFLVALGQNNDKYLWDASSGDLLATMVNFGDYFSSRSDNWLVVTPDGLFDGSPAAWSQILWQFGGDTFDVTPAETFFNEFYYPGLLGEIMAGRRPHAPKNIEQLDRRQPEIRLIIQPSQGAAVSERNLAVKIEVTETPAERDLKGSGARDLRLFRNGSLVKFWRGDILKGQATTTLEATIPILAGENRLTAYAFNRDNVKSKDATVRLTGADSLKREGTCYILTVGLNLYENPQYNLQYASADALAFAEELRRQLQKVGRYQKTEVIPLFDRDATKANILFALKRLAGNPEGLAQGAPAVLQQLKPAQPEDTIAIFYAGHGTTQGQRFYLIPHDLGYSGDRAALDAVGLQTILQHGISDEELEGAVEGLDAGNVLMVIDACNSGQALEAEEKRRGPMNAKGLAQLAYEKGMYILTAAQAYQAALEAAQLGHGYLTYSLVEEGLKQMSADRAPKDNQVLLREWFDFATQRVPEMQEAKLREARRLGRKLSFVHDQPKKSPSVDAEESGIQQPRVFYRRELESQPLIVAKP
jgi:WD40 repeat protein